MRRQECCMMLFQRGVKKKSLLSDKELTTDHCMDTTKVQFSKQLSFITVIYRNNG